VEVDGATHSTEKEVGYDAKRTAFLERRGWRVLRVTNTDVFENLDGVWLAVERRLPPPAAARPASPASGGGNRS
jgi:very-short-patch-repair endonuclease